MKTNIKEIKSTILGTILLFVGIIMILWGEYKVQEYNEIFAGALVVIGILLWFAPDRFINLLIEFLSRIAGFFVSLVSAKASALTKKNEPEQKTPTQEIP